MQNIKDGEKKQWVNKTVDKFIVLNQILGEGAFGTVYKGYFKNQPSKLVACKAIHSEHVSNSAKVLELVKREIEVLQKLQKNKYITCLYDVARTKNNVYMFLEFCQDGNLKEYIKKKNILSENEAVLIFKHLCEGFKDLNKNEIIHRDVKPENILLHSGSAKLSDFGFARVIETGCEIPGYFSKLGTPYYMAPQILEDSPFSSKCDVWSMGVVLYEMLYGKLPWSGKSQVELLKNIKQKPLGFPEDPPRSDEIKKLLQQMLVVKEENRISWAQIFKSDIITNSQISNSSQLINSQVYNQNIKSKDQNVQNNTENEEYLQQNLVQGYIDQDIQPDKSLSSYTNDEQKKMESIQSTEQDMNVSQIFQNQLKQQEARKHILTINEYILHERNISFFFNYVLQLLVKSYNSDILKLEPHLYFRLIFCLSKNQNITLQRIIHLLQSEKSQVFAQNAWDNYKNSREFKKTKDIIRTDQLHSQTFFKQVFEKTKSIVDQYLSQENNNNNDHQNETDSESNPGTQKQQQQLQSYKLIITPEFQFNQQFKEKYKETIQLCLDILKEKIMDITKTQQKEILIIVKYLLVSQNPYQEFKPNPGEHFDFNVFYEKIEKSSNLQLQKQLIDQIQGKLQTNNNNINGNNSNISQLQQQQNGNNNTQGKYTKFNHSKTLKK